jgi:hypothetical protein
LYDYFHNDLELPASEAEAWATTVLEFGQNEFGVLVPLQEQHVGLLHRIFQEYLAAKHLSRLAFDRVKAYCAEAGRKRPWHEVTLTLLQLLDRQDDVDLLIEELRKPVTDYLDEPGQQILLPRLAASDTNCSRGKACEIMLQVFSLIECGRWMPLRLALVREVAAGLQSEQVASLVAARAARWFPGRLRWLYEVPAAASKQPTSNTLSDLWIALHNCHSNYEYRSIAEALATFAESSPELVDKFLAILKESADPELMAAALHAIASGWPTHEVLPALLDAATKAPAQELQHVAILARFKRGERSPEVRDALVGFCREGQWLWPWEKEIVRALATGWPRDPELKRDALERIGGIRHPMSWAPALAINYLLRGCPGDDDVARMVANQLAQELPSYPELRISDVHEDLIAGFTAHPLLVPAIEAWLEKNAEPPHSPMDVAVLARVGGTPKCRQALLGWLRRNAAMPAWIISTLLEMTAPDDPDLQSVLTEYIRDERRRSEAVRWLPGIVHEPKELGVMLRRILRSAHVFDSCSALAILVEREGRDAPDLWPLIEKRLANDNGSHYWRLGHQTLIKIWPEHPLIKQLVKSTIYDEEMSLSSLYEAYGNNPEIRPLLDLTMQVLHEDLRIEFAHAIEPLVRRGVPAAIAVAAEFRYEPNGEARTVAARAYARACVRAGRQVPELAATLSLDLAGFDMGREQRQQAAVAALLELGRADLVAVQREDGQPLQLSTSSNSHHNWEFVATVVEHWEALAAAVPDIWARFKHSPIIATELAKAGKGAHALNQIQIFENAIRTGTQLEVEHVKALIALHGHSTLLRDLFVARLQHFLPGRQQSMMVMEMAAYQAMASYVTDHFHGDVAIAQAMVAVATSPMICEVGLISLCRGWPNSPQIASATANLPKLIEADEPVTAWLFASKADSALMAKYLVRYPSKLIRQYFGEPRDGIKAVRTRLQSDRECREAVFSELKKVTEPDTMIALTKLLTPSMRNDKAFRFWISNQLSLIRENEKALAPLAFYVLANACKPVEFALLEAVLTQS